MKKIIQIGVFILLIGLLVTRVDWAQVWSYMTNANLLWLGVFVVLYILGIVIASQKWRVIAVQTHCREVYR